MAWSTSPRWPQVRAALIAAAMLVHGCAAMPLPRALRPQDQKSAYAQEEIARWLGILHTLGVDLGADELVSMVNEVGETATSTRKTLLTPVAWALRLTGTGQSWALFAYPDQYPNRLELEVRSGKGDWETVFRAGDPQVQLLGDAITFRRVRGVYDTVSTRSSPGKVYDRFADWVGREVLAARLDADEVRVKMVQFRVTLPGEDDDQEEKTRLVRLRRREGAADGG